MQPLTGVIPANLLPMNADLTIDEVAYRAHLETLATTDGVTAITCNGHAAEVSSLDRAERHFATSVAVETVAGRVPVIAGVYANDETDGLEYAADAEAAGADALLLLPPNSLEYDDDPHAGFRYFSAIASRVSLPLVAFMYPSSTGLQYSREVLTKLCSIDSVVAVKEWSLDIAAYERTLEVVRSAPHHVSLLSSFSTHLLPSLALGADGVLSGHGSIAAHLQHSLVTAIRAGDLTSARAVYARLQKLTTVVYRAPMPNMYARMKEQLGMLGSPVQPFVRPPLRQVTATERETLQRALVDAEELTGCKVE